MGGIPIDRADRAGGAFLEKTVREVQAALRQSLQLLSLFAKGASFGGKGLKRNHSTGLGQVRKVRIQCRKELRWLQMEGADDAFHTRQSDVALATLHAAQIAAVQAAVLCKGLLREPLLPA